MCLPRQIYIIIPAQRDQCETGLPHSQSTGRVLRQEGGVLPASQFSSTVAHATTPSPVQLVKCTELVRLPHATVWTLTGMCTGMKDTSGDIFFSQPRTFHCRKLEGEHHSGVPSHKEQVPGGLALDLIS